MKILALTILCISLHAVEVNQYKLADGRVIEGIAEETRPNYYDIHIYYEGKSLGSIPNVHHTEFDTLPGTVMQDDPSPKERAKHKRKNDFDKRHYKRLGYKKYKKIHINHISDDFKKCRATAVHLTKLYQVNLDNMDSPYNRKIFNNVDDMIRKFQKDYEWFFIAWRERYVRWIDPDDVDDSIEYNERYAPGEDSDKTPKEIFIEIYNKRQLQTIHFYLDVLNYTDKTWPVEYFNLMYGIEIISVNDYRNNKHKPKHGIIGRSGDWIVTGLNDALLVSVTQELEIWRKL